MKNIKNQSIKQALVLSILLANVPATHAQNNSTECCFYANANTATIEYVEKNIGNQVIHTVPEGAISGVFSISPNKQVYFSQGNLQHQASTGTWRFAEHQYDYIGGKNSRVSPRYNGWIDLFCWGSSGWNSGVKYYQPWHKSITVSDIESRCATYTCDLTGNYEFADWGVYNAISNGGDQAGLWRTLTSDEWRYVFNERQASTLNGNANARYVYAKVAKVKGIILFPNNYTHPTGVKLPLLINDLKDKEEPPQYFSYIHESDGKGWEKNIYSISDWEMMEKAGCVFLPAAGYRSGTSVYGYKNNRWDSEGCYWSASYCCERCDHHHANCLNFKYNRFWPDCFKSFFLGLSVRLVYPVQ